MQDFCSFLFFGSSLTPLFGITVCVELMKFNVTQVNIHGDQMVIGTGKIKFKLYGIDSLKGKRSIIKSIISRIRNKFNISIAETDFNDSYLWAEIGFAIIGNDSRVVNSMVDKVLNFAEELGLAEIADSQIEIIHL